jgi:hypothetical protein
MSSAPFRMLLAELNRDSSLERVEIDGFATRRQFRVGHWGLRKVNRPGPRAGIGSGGERYHLMVGYLITALPMGFDAAAYCAAHAPVSKGTAATPSDANERARGHGGSQHTQCMAPRIGDLLRAFPLCQKDNVRPADIYTPEQNDTISVDCRDCARRKELTGTPTLF